MSAWRRLITDRSQQPEHRVSAAIERVGFHRRTLPTDPETDTNVVLQALLLPDREGRNVLRPLKDDGQQR